jgi:hypothetical protein
MMDDKTLVNRMLNAFEDTPEIASWFEQNGKFYDYKMAETHDHLLGMWETMKEAAHRINAQAAEIEQWRECALYDATMKGPAFKGWDRSALDRCRKRGENLK